MNVQNEKEEAFARAYVATMNAAEAARRCGFNGATGTSMLRRPAVQQIVRRLIDERNKRLEIEADDVVNMLRQIVFFDVTDVVTVETELRDESAVSKALREHEETFPHMNDLFAIDGGSDASDGDAEVMEERKQVVVKDSALWSEAARRAVTGIAMSERGHIKVQFFSREKAVELLCRHLGILSDGELDQGARARVALMPPTQIDELVWQKRHQERIARIEREQAEQSGAE